MAIRNSNLKSRKEGTNGGWSKGESLLGPNQRSSSVYSSHQNGPPGSSIDGNMLHKHTREKETQNI